MEEFWAYRDLCSKDEWVSERQLLIVSRESIEKRCELIAEEKITDEPYHMILGTEKELVLFNKYGFCLPTPMRITF